MIPSASVLVLTVGTGNVDKLEESLFRPLEKSLKEGNWKEAVLLPSTMTEANAEKFKNRMHDYSIQIIRLPEEGQENDADACFSHFDEVLTGLRERGYETGSITPDFTRGTKAMSAALVLAAVRHKIRTLRYIHGARDPRGLVLAGAEKVSEVSTGRVTTQRQINDARQLMGKGAFAAARELLPDVNASQFAAILVPNELQSEMSRLRRLAAFWSAWDRLDYKGAMQCATKLDESDCNKLKNEIACVKQLDRQPRDDKHHAAMAEWLRRLATDLLANGYRRIKQNQFEDAILRAHRVLELIGHSGLFALGYDSASINAEDPDVKEFQRLSRKEDYGNLVPNEERTGFLTAPRMVAAHFLAHLGDPLGKKLVCLDQENPVSRKSRRNRSILIHGFSVADQEPLSELYDEIKALLDEYCSNEMYGISSERFGVIP